MFVQLIEGKTSDADGLHRQLDRWQQELRPGATGYIGSTGGVADDGTVFMAARFESEDAAKANSDRPEQTAWWNETSKYLDGEATFSNSTDVDTTLAGGSNDAGFVQVMRGETSNRARLVELEQKVMSNMSEVRPDVIGSTRSWQGNAFTEVIYFTSEAAARKGEQAMGDATAQAGDDMAEFGELLGELTFIDLKQPWLYGS